MKRSFLSALFIIISIAGFTQKVNIRLIHNRGIGSYEWQVLNEKYLPLFTGNEYPDADTVIFPLESNKRYFLNISLLEIKTDDTVLLSLSINDETIIRVLTDIGTGDHFFPFFTGVKSDDQSKITGGTDTDISEFPWQIYLESDNAVCGGSIIDNEWVITAAHCVRDDNNITIPASKMIVVVGANNPRDPRDGKEYSVNEVIVHENFDSRTLNNDIALLRLTERINYPNAEPIKLVSSKDASDGATDPGVMTWLTGYGITSVDPRIYPTTLQVVRLPVVSNEQASVVWRNIPASDIMAGYLDGNKDACTGDSGGPLVVPVSDKLKLAGLVSWGSSQCDTYGAYTRISLFESWITSKTGIEITFKAPVPQGDSIICPGTFSSEYEVSPVKDATLYNWSLLPANAGTISFNNETATVLWNSEYLGTAAIGLEVSRIDETSEPSKLNVNLARQTSFVGVLKDTVICAEQDIYLQLEVEGYNLIYNWYKDGDLISSNTLGELRILNSITDDSGNYFCQINGSCGSLVSNTFNLTVLPVTKITNITSDTELEFGDNLTLEASTEGHSLDYQWYKNDASINSGTNSILPLLNVNATDIGLYKTIVTGTCGTETSREVYIYVKNSTYPEQTDIFVWPTVVENEFKIAVENDDFYNLSLFNTLGKLIMKLDNCQYITNIDIGTFPAGIYIINIHNRDLRKSVKIIKK